MTFWHTQPVCVSRCPNSAGRFGPSSEDLPSECKRLVESSASTLPGELSHLQFETLHLRENGQHLDDVHRLLTDAFIGGTGTTLLLSQEAILWHLCPPGYQAEWHIGIRERNAGGALVAFLGGIPETVQLKNPAAPFRADASTRSEAITLSVCNATFLSVVPSLRGTHLVNYLMAKLFSRTWDHGGIKQIMFGTARRPFSPTTVGWTYSSPLFDRLNGGVTPPNVHIVNTFRLRPVEASDLTAIQGIVAATEPHAVIRPGTWTEEYVSWRFFPRDGVLMSFISAGRDAVITFTQVVYRLNAGAAVSSPAFDTDLHVAVVHNCFCTNSEQFPALLAEACRLLYRQHPHLAAVQIDDFAIRGGKEALREVGLRSGLSFTPELNSSAGLFMYNFSIDEVASSRCILRLC